MDRYIYDGPVLEFGKCIYNRWHGETMAESEAKAYSNLKYQFRKKYNKAVNSRLELPGNIIFVRGGH